MGINIENYFIKSVTFLKWIPVDKIKLDTT